MQYIRKDLGSFNLHMVKTDKFKTMTVKVVFERPIKKDEITIRNILTDILLTSSYNYKSKRDLSIKAEELYAADIYNNSSRLGNYLITSFNIQVLNDKYTEKGNFEESIKFLSDIIFNPDIENNKFNEEKLNIVKHNAKVALDSIKEDTVGYSILRLNEVYDKTGVISYRMTGYLSDLDNINTSNLYEYYTDVIDKDFVDIFVVGDFDEKEMLSIIKKYFMFRKLKKKNIPYELDYKKARKRRLIAKEECDTTQSKLAIACPLSKMNIYEKTYPLALANIIFGGGVDSKLFKEIREENSLCYSIYSYVSRVDNILTITSGIDRDNFDKSVKLITKILNELKKGKFSDKDIENAKEYYLSSLEEFEESEYRIIYEFLQQELLKVPSYIERKRVIKDVKKSDIVKVFKKINMDTIFLLEGVRECEK